MKQVATSLAIAAIFAGASATPTPAVAAGAPPAPCALIKNAQAAGNKTVSAQTAYDCFRSVPLGKQEGIKLVDALVPYLEWQSDPTYKANPPASYSYPGYDLKAGLKTVRDNLVNNKYDSEYAFQSDLVSKVFFPGHDGHLYYYPDLLARATKFARPNALVSISTDGSSIPVIKFADDVTALGAANALTVTKINGVDAPTFIQNEAKIGCGSQDADACYNQQFYQKASTILGSKKGAHADGGRSSYLYQGATTTYTMSDGTTRTYDNIANIKGSFSNVTDGPSFYSNFCKPVNPPTDNSTPVASANGGIPGYPTPVLMTKDGIVSGFYLEGKGYEEVAVIALFAFENSNQQEFQSVIEKFFAQARADGKTKLVVDFQGNGGGYILHGYDFFKQLFPSSDYNPDGYSRWRANQAYRDIADVYSDITESNPNASTATSWFSWQSDLNTNGTHFEDYDDKTGPYTINNDSYTNIMRYDLDNKKTFGGFSVTGYADRSEGFTAPFKAEDIILLYDGYCASTCTLASEMLRIQGGVKSVAFGGRPNQSGIQGVGGIKGAQVLGMQNIQYYANYASRYTSDAAYKKEFARYTSLPFQRATKAGVNVRDQILRGNVQDGIPAQFVYEKADCRRYFTADMLTDITAVWKAAADSGFFNAKCVEGGIKRTKRETTADEYISRADTAVIRRGTNILEGDYPKEVHSAEWLDEQLQRVD